jgi:hypothetical protein
MFRTQGYPYDTRLARRLGEDRARRRREAVAPARAGVAEGPGTALDPVAVGAAYQHRDRELHGLG